ncbi:MAG: hypothetical protein ACE37D_09665 [Pseudomonadales bacterium]
MLDDEGFKQAALHGLATVIAAAGTDKVDRQAKTAPGTHGDTLKHSKWTP